MVTVDQIMDYESGEMTGPETIEFFQELIDDGLAWTLQGHYGRTAARLIDTGECYEASEETEDAGPKEEWEGPSDFRHGTYT